MKEMYLLSVMASFNVFFVCFLPTSPFLKSLIARSPLPIAVVPETPAAVVVAETTACPPFPLKSHPHNIAMISHPVSYL
ncbi:MAG: hypothetical protein ACTFAL_08015 [Candidatus Electronema sp. V4]|uniref:hypothetical protein n=1 Tax=Candidatus Electronema sp. V4 TaxID=3454756 RepID=UPI0040559571